MGGGGGKTPEPKTFTPPPLQDGPAKNPIPNFFAGVGGERLQSPYEALAALSQVLAPQNPFQGLQGGAQPPLLRREINQQPDIAGTLQSLQGRSLMPQGSQPSAPAPAATPSQRDLIRAATFAARDAGTGKGSVDDYQTALRAAVDRMFKGGR